MKIRRWKTKDGNNIVVVLSHIIVIDEDQSHRAVLWLSTGSFVTLEVTQNQVVTDIVSAAVE